MARSQREQSVSRSQREDSELRIARKREESELRVASLTNLAIKKIV